MKKHFILLSTFAAWMLSATLLTACGDDVQTPEKVGTKPEISTETTASTIFSTGDDGTRTWLDTERRFYWSEGDQIYVNTTGDTYQKTSKSTLSTDSRTADFVLEGVKLTAKKCSLMYIGNGTTAATVTASDLKVKIEAEQTQSQWGSSAHLGVSGDCGFAEAERDDATGKYSFKLTHKAAYLVFQPYKASDITDSWRLLRIEIIANGGTTLVGEYPFGTGELGTGTYTNKVVRLKCGTDGFTLDASASKSCFAVIQPGSHELTIRYYIKPTGVIYGGFSSDYFVIDKKIDIRPYSANSVTTIKHKLGVVVLSPNYDFYQWDAPVDEPYLSTYPNTNWNTTVPKLGQATQSCKDMPTPNEITWYMFKGDPHYTDRENGTMTYHTFDYGHNIYITWGVWFLKSTEIPGFSKEVGYDGITDFSQHTSIFRVDATLGLPSDTSKYFYLPALGYYTYANIPTELRNYGVVGYYWSSLRGNSNGGTYALRTYNGRVYFDTGNFGDGILAAPDWFQ